MRPSVRVVKRGFEGSPVVLQSFPLIFPTLRRVFTISTVAFDILSNTGSGAWRYSLAHPLVITNIYAQGVIYVWLSTTMLWRPSGVGAPIRTLALAPIIGHPRSGMVMQITSKSLPVTSSATTDTSLLSSSSSPSPTAFAALGY